MKITRKDGITYERKPKTKKYDSHLLIRIKKEDINNIKLIAKNKNTNYNKLIRNLIEEYIKENYEKNI